MIAELKIRSLLFGGLKYDDGDRVFHYPGLMCYIY